MPPLETMDRTVSAVWWIKNSVDRYGEETYQTPIEIKVRWIDNRKRVSGQNTNSVGYDISLVADRDLVAESVIWKGKLVDLPNPQDGVIVINDLMRIESSKQTQDLKGRFTRYEANANRYKSQIAAATGNFIGNENQLIGDENSMIGATT